jgi:cation diffusion facilitator family transporter
VLALGRSGRSPDALVGYIVLALAGLAEGTSLLRAYRQVRSEARGDRDGLLHHLRSSPDTTVKAALFEDTAAVIGLVLAAAGLTLRQLTGSGLWDGAGSIAIGALLVVVAVRLGLDSRELLIGRAADPREVAAIRAEVEGVAGIAEVRELQTMHLGPDQLIVAARVSLVDGIDADQVEELSDRIDRRLAERLPQVPHVFIDPTQKP